MKKGQKMNMKIFNFLSTPLKTKILYHKKAQSLLISLILNFKTFNIF